MAQPAQSERSRDDSRGGDTAPRAGTMPIQFRRYVSEGLELDITPRSQDRSCIECSKGFAPALGFQKRERAALPSVGFAIDPSQGVAKHAGAERAVDNPINDILERMFSSQVIHGRQSRIRP